MFVLCVLQVMEQAIVSIKREPEPTLSALDIMAMAAVASLPASVPEEKKLVEASKGKNEYNWYSTTKLKTALLQLWVRALLHVR